MIGVAMAPKVIMDTSSISVAPLVYELINGEPGSYGRNWSFAVLNGTGRFEGGVVFNNFHQDYGRAELHLAGVSKGWLNATVLRTIMKSALDLGLQLVIAKTDPENKVVIRFMMFAGARKYLIEDMRGPGKHEVLLTLKMSDMVQTKFWRRKNGRQIS
jgi:RimJ/RimL family protein N-acetyltransferase